MHGDIETVHTPEAPAAIGPYSQAVMVGDLVFTSGQVALDPATGQLVAGGFEAQVQQVLANLEAVLKAAGSSLTRAVKVTVYLKDFNDFSQLNQLYGAAFGNARPARSTVEVARLPRDARVEIDIIAKR